MEEEHIHIINTVDENEYEMINGGINPQAEMVLETIEIKLEDIKRFRDAGFDKYAKVIWLLTRTGIENAYSDLKGMNNDHLTENKHFITRYSESFDQTYELYIFRPFIKYLTFKHVPIPNMKIILKRSLARLEESGQLNDLEQTFVDLMNKTIVGD